LRVEIAVSLSTAAREAAPSSPMLLSSILQSTGIVGVEREGMGVSVGTEAKAAHSKWVRRVSLRVAASTEAPLSMIALREMLRGGGVVHVRSP